jgi:uncharacterized protein
MNLFDPFVFCLVFTGVFIICFMKGAFGGGFAIIGIPLLSLAMSPLEAGALLAPLFVVMDMFALRYWSVSNWSKPDLTLLVPGLITGLGLGFVLLHYLNRDLIAIVMALITLGFVGLWLKGGQTVSSVPPSIIKASTAGLASGFTSMVAHSGGPPLTIYLLSRALPKALHAGTASMFFTIGNVIKAGPWLILGQPSSQIWLLIVLCVPIVPFGVWAGWKLHQRLDQAGLVRACYGLLVLTSAKLLWDGMKGYGII